MTIPPNLVTYHCYPVQEREKWESCLALPQGSRRQAKISSLLVICALCRTDLFNRAYTILMSLVQRQFCFLLSHPFSTDSVQQINFLRWGEPGTAMGTDAREADGARVDLEQWQLCNLSASAWDCNLPCISLQKASAGESTGLVLHSSSGSWQLGLSATCWPWRAISWWSGAFSVLSYIAAFIGVSTSGSLKGLAWQGLPAGQQCELLFHTWWNRDSVRTGEKLLL